MSETSGFHICFSHTVTWQFSVLEVSRRPFDILSAVPPSQCVTLESAAIAALGVVVTALAALYEQLRRKSEKCEQWRDEKEPIIQDLSQKYGALSILSNLVSGCKKDGCSFAGKDYETTYSVRVKKHQAPHPPQ